MKAINRFVQYCDFKGIKPSRFEKQYGLSNGYFSVQAKRNGSLGEDALRVIVDNCLDLDPEWLLTGRGEMLNIPKEKEVAPGNEVMLQQKIIEMLEKEIARLEQENKKLKKEKANAAYNIHVAEPSPELKKEPKSE